MEHPCPTQWLASYPNDRLFPMIFKQNNNTYMRWVEIEDDHMLRIYDLYDYEERAEKMTEWERSRVPSWIKKEYYIFIFNRKTGLYEKMELFDDIDVEPLEFVDIDGVKQIQAAWRGYQKKKSLMNSK